MKRKSTLSASSFKLGPDVSQNVIDFHYSQTFTFDPRFRSNLFYPPLDDEVLQEIQFKDIELSPFYQDLLPCDPIDVAHLRNSSQRKFSKQKISIDAMKSLLTLSFKMTSDGKRPYPSGGGLYPIEVLCFAFAERVEGIDKTSLYHYRPSINSLQPLSYYDNDDEILLKLFGGSWDVPPHFFILYLAFLPKALIKYRYRGYRHALIEVGSMAQQVEIIAKNLELSSCLHSGFNDYEIMKLIHMDCRQFLPVVMHAIGRAP